MPSWVFSLTRHKSQPCFEIFLSFFFCIGRSGCIPALLPFFRVRNLQHRLASLIDPIKRVKSVEINAPTRLLMLNGDVVITKDHLWGRNAQLLGHLVDRLGLEDRKLLRRDAEAAYRDRLGLFHLRGDCHMARRPGRRS